MTAACLLAVAGSGCITIAPSSQGLSWKSLTKPKAGAANFSEQLDEAPGDPKDPAQLKLAYAKLMEESGKLKEARNHYAGVLELQPKNVDAILGVARVDLANGNLESAEKEIERAIKLAPDSAAAHYAMGRLHASQKRWNPAADSLAKAMLAAPQETQYRYYLAVALTHVGDIDSALPHFIRTVGDAEAHYNVGLILQEEGRVEQAERHFQLAVTKKPELVQARNRLVHLRQSRQKSHPAIEPAEISPEVIPAGHQTMSEPVEFHPPISATVRSAETQSLSSQQLEQMKNQAQLAHITP